MSDASTDQARWRRIEALLDRALELDRDAVAPFLDRACAGAPELRAEVEAYLDAEQKAGDFLERPMAEAAVALLETPGAAPETPAPETPSPETPGTPPDVLPADHQLGPYRVIRWLGGGGMGLVYEAVDTRLGRHVALKLLPPEWSRDPAAKERFLREARAASRLDHPNICALHDIGETDDGRLYLVMAFCDGETLKRKLARGPLPVDEARRLALQIARGLRRAHEAGIVHRDVKPANVIVTDRGEAKLVDFGIAKVAGEAALTATGRSLGTPYYMSPEQARGEPVDARTDIWALGVVLHEMLTGRRPFAGDRQTAVIYSILETDPEPLRRLRRDVPEDLERVVTSALAKDPAERYPGMGELLADLNPKSAPDVPIAAVEPASAALASAAAVEPGAGHAPAAAVEPGAGPAPVAAGGSTPTPADRRRRLALVALLLATVAAAAAVVTLRPRAPEPASAASAALDVDVRRLLDQGRTYEERGDTPGNLELAERVYRQALARAPDEPAVQGRLAALLARVQGQFPEPGRGEEIRRLADRALAADPELAPAWLARGKLLLMDGDAAGALDAARRAVEAAPEDHAGHALAGEALIAAGRVEEGLDRLRRALALPSGHVWPRLTLARCLLELGRTNEAAAEYEKVLAYVPDSPNALNNLATIYVLTGRDSDAIPLLNRSLAHHRDDYVAANLGFAYFNLDRLEEAIEAFTEAHELAPENPHHRRNLGDAYEKLGDDETARRWFERAIDAYDRALEAGGPRAQLVGFRAVAEAKLGRFEPALQGVEEALALAPASALHLFLAAQVHALAERRDETLDYVRRALEAGYSREEFRRDPAFAGYREDPAFRALLDYPVTAS